VNRLKARRTIYDPTDYPVRTRKTARRMSKVVVQNVLLAILACTFASCATTFNVTTKRAAGAPRFPPSDPARVEILRTEPQRTYDRLGYIVVDASTDPIPPIEKVLAKVRSEAGKLGADAVVVVYDRVQSTEGYVLDPAGWGGATNFSLETLTERKLAGVAIKYRP